MSPIDLVKELKALYLPSAKHPAIVDVPEMNFLMLDGRGDPDGSAEYEAALGALYSTAYTLKFSLKKAAPERDFKVAPLEGLWWTDFVAEQGYELRGHHHEIYLGDPRRTAPERLKTVVRHPLQEIAAPA